MNGKILSTDWRAPRRRFRTLEHYSATRGSDVRKTPKSCCSKGRQCTRSLRDGKLLGEVAFLRASRHAIVPLGIRKNYGSQSIVGAVAGAADSIVEANVRTYPMYAITETNCTMRYLYNPGPSTSTLNATLFATDTCRLLLVQR